MTHMSLGERTLGPKDASRDEVLARKRQPLPSRDEGELLGAKPRALGFDNSSTISPATYLIEVHSLVHMVRQCTCWIPLQ